MEIYNQPGLTKSTTFPLSVNINKVENGYIVHVGCKEFVADTWEQVSSGLELYFRAPEEARNKYCR